MMKRFYLMFPLLFLLSLGQGIQVSAQVYIGKSSTVLTDDTKATDSAKPANYQITVGPTLNNSNTFTGSNSFNAVTATSYNVARVMVDRQSGADFGAKLANCLLALPSAGGICDASNVQGGSAAATFNMNKSGVEIILGPGAYTWSGSPGIAWTAHGSSMHPVTTYDAVILYTTSATADLMTVSAGGLNHFYDFATASSVLKTAGAAIRVTSGQNIFDRMILYPTFDGLVFGASGGSNHVSNLYVNGLGGSGVNWHCPILNGGVGSGTVSGNTFDYVVASANGSAPTDATFCMQDGSDTIYISNSVMVANVGGNDTVELHTELVNAGNAPSNIFVINTDFEGGLTKNAVVIDSCFECDFMQDTVASSLNGLVINAGNRVKWVGGQFYLNQQNGVSITGGTDVDISHARFMNNSQAANNTSDDILVAANITGFKFIGNTFKKTGAPANLPKYNIEIAAGTSSFYTIVGNLFPGDFVTGNIIDGGSGAAKTLINEGVLADFSAGNITASQSPNQKIGFSGDLATARGIVWFINTSTLDWNLTNANKFTFVGGPVMVPALNTITNCSSSAAPAVCGSAPAGSFVIAAAGTSVTVNTTAVTANSQIFVQEDESLGSKLGVTCNTGILANPPAITARTAATSFAVGITAGLAVNPVCFSYWIVN